MTHKITNESRRGRSYIASNGQRIHFDPGETKELSTLPPEEDGWRIEATEENQKPEEEDSEGGDN